MVHSPPDTSSPEPTDSALIDVVRSMGEEIRGLQAASRTRAVIEQAKGVLVERHHISLDEAFDRLRRMSQEHNVRLVEVAATIVGVAITDTEPGDPDLPEEVLLGRMAPSPAASRTWQALRRQPEVRAGVASVLAEAMAGATDRGDQAVALLVDLLAPHAVDAATLYRSADDGSLRLVGQHRVPGDVISSWRSIPPLRDIPYVRAVDEGRAMFWRDKAERAAQFPAVGDGRTDFSASAVVPIFDEGSTIGIAGLLWQRPQDFDKDRIEAITRTVQRLGAMLLRDATAQDPDQTWLEALLRLHLDPWIVLNMSQRHVGTFRDSVVEDAAHGLAGADSWLGRRWLEVWPTALRDRVSSALEELSATGGARSMTVDGTETSDVPWGRPGTRVRAVRLGRRIVIVWRPPTPGDDTGGESDGGLLNDPRNG